MCGHNSIFHDVFLFMSLWRNTFSSGIAYNFGCHLGFSNRNYSQITKGIFKDNSINCGVVSKIVQIFAEVEDHQRSVTDYWSKSTIKIVCTEPILTSNPLKISRTVKRRSHVIILRT